MSAMSGWLRAFLICAICTKENAKFNARLAILLDIFRLSVYNDTICYSYCSDGFITEVNDGRRLCNGKGNCGKVGIEG